MSPVVENDERRIQKGRKKRPQKRSEEAKNSDVAKTIELDRTIEQIPDAARTDECFARVADEPAKNHRRRNVTLQFCHQMRRGANKSAASKIELGGQRTETGCGRSVSANPIFAPR